MGDLPLRTPTYRCHGEPLPLHLANRTHAHLLPQKFSSIRNASLRSYGVLFKISLDYPPVKGRLHTRYAPVRRSSARCKHPLLPLDLHVLSLPLAFILSQDQTLRCCFLILLQLKIDFVSKWLCLLVCCIFRYALSFQIFNELVFFAPINTNSIVGTNPGNGCKYKTLF